jgi:adenylate kinase
MRVLMVAPPGAGKGTQGAVIAAHFGIPHIATGDLLRDHVARRTELGLAVQHHLDRGELVPDDVVLDMVRAEMVTAKERGGYVLDGVPRSMPQARSLYQIGRALDMTADVALHLKADDDELIRRLLARAALERRSDDTEDVIRRRLELYRTVTYPIVDWYAARGILVSVDAMRPADRVGRQILTALESMRPLLEHVPAHARRPVDLTELGAAFGDSGEYEQVGKMKEPGDANQPRETEQLREK